MYIYIRNTCILYISIQKYAFLSTHFALDCSYFYQQLFFVIVLFCIGVYYDVMYMHSVHYVMWKFVACNSMTANTHSRIEHLNDLKQRRGRESQRQSQNMEKILNPSTFV